MIQKKDSSKIYIISSFLLLIIISLFVAIIYEKNKKESNRVIKINLDTKVEEALNWKFSTKNKIFVYSLFMLPIVIIPYFIGFSGNLYIIISLSLTLYYNYICYDLYKFKKNKFELKKAKKVFSYSIFYLFLLFVLFLIDQIIK